MISPRFTDAAAGDTCVYRKLDPDVLMMKSAENRM